MAVLARYKDLCLDVTAPLADSALPAFWAAALGLAPAPHRDRVEKLTGTQPTETVWLNEVPEAHTVKNRVHLDVHCASVADLEALGARRLTPYGEFSWTLLADPDGNEFDAFVRDEVPAYRLYELEVDSLDPEAQAAWWQGVWGGELQRGRDGLVWIEHIPGAPFESVDFVPVPEPKTVKNRVHWDVVGPDLAPLLAHGATVLRSRDDDIDWDVLADPEGNEFCFFLPAP